MCVYAFLSLFSLFQAYFCMFVSMLITTLRRNRGNYVFHCADDVLISALKLQKCSVVQIMTELSFPGELLHL